MSINTTDNDYADKFSLLLQLIQVYKSKFENNLDVFRTFLINFQFKYLLARIRLLGRFTTCLAQTTTA